VGNRNRLPTPLRVPIKATVGDVRDVLPNAVGDLLKLGRQLTWVPFVAREPIDSEGIRRARPMSAYRLTVTPDKVRKRASACSERRKRGGV
jgi:hypothetical protein